jgi:hypothetical protein
MLRLHPVTVTHGPLEAATTHLLDTELPDLREIHREPDYAILSFETAEAAAAFITAAQGVIPTAWSVAAGALPDSASQPATRRGRGSAPA